MRPSTMMKPTSRRFLRDRHRRLLRLVIDSWRKLAVATACMVVISASTAATAYLIKPVLDDIFFKKDLVMLRVIPPAVLLLYVVRGLAMFFEEYLMNHIGQNILRRLRNEVYSHIQSLPLSFFQSEKTGVLMSRITHDINIVRNLVTSAITGSIRDVLTIIGLVGVIFYQIWQLALIAFIVLPAAYFPILYLGRRVRRNSRGCQEAVGDLNAFLHETFAGAKIVKAFGREAYEKKRFADRTAGLFRLEMKQALARSLSSPVNEVLAGVGIALIIWYGGSHVVQGTYSTGTFLSFMAAVLMLYEPVKKLSKLNNQLQQGLAAVDRIFEILERESDILDPPQPVPIATKPHRVVFDQVCFRYDRQMVLKGIRLDVAPGEVVALVGMSGGGKTSLVNLIPRFYDVSSGSVSIDGVDIRQMAVAELRRQIAVVTQEPILFNDTVRHNIAYGNPEAGEAEIRQAAQAAFADEFIQGFPAGFDTPIGELGGRLSGGQKQRICIARALLKNAPILILDEATSSLDSEAETLVQRALENLMQNRTTFVIAHRLSTINHAHRIVVLVDGCIVEEGAHDALMDRRGEYFKLYTMQYCDVGRQTDDSPQPAARRTAP
jgi:subfamily B ATP-binding cassette protein MsbA